MSDYTSNNDQTTNVTDTDVRTFQRNATRQRLLECGVASLSDMELLSMLLPSNAKSSAYDLASTLLMRFGGLRKLLTADSNAMRDAGVTDAAFATLQASLELTRRHYRELMQVGSALSNPRATREYVRMQLRDLPHEIFAVIALDNRHRVIKYVELFRGTLDGASVHPREIVKLALGLNAAACIFIHNHPSGVAEPSQADELITRRLKEALGLVDIRVLDHLIVGDGVCESFAERGLL
jgi:DNA repair protein RadC